MRTTPDSKIRQPSIIIACRKLTSCRPERGKRGWIVIREARRQQAFARRGNEEAETEQRGSDTPSSGSDRPMLAVWVAGGISNRFPSYMMLCISHHGCSICSSSIFSAISP